MKKKIPIDLWLGLLLTSFMFLFALVGFYWTPFSVFQLSIAEKLSLPNIKHLWGTDYLGRDLLSLSMIGLANDLIMCLLAVCFGLFIGGLMGCYAALKGSIVNKIINRMNDIIFAFPIALTALCLMSYFGPSRLVVIITIGLFNISVFSRFTRSLVQSLLKKDFIRASWALGARPHDIIIRHIIPGIFSLILAQFIIQMAIALLVEVGLSFLGASLQAPDITLGKIITDGLPSLTKAPWPVIGTTLIIALTVTGLSLLGQGIRTLKAPKAPLWIT